MKIAACQVPDVRNDPERALRIVRSCTFEAQRQGARMVLFPECFLQGYELTTEHVASSALDLRGAEFAALLRSLSDLEPLVLLGLIEKDAGGSYNTAAVCERGRLLARYRKQHLTDSEQAVFVPGTEGAVFEVDGIKVGITICYDLQFADAVAGAARAGAKVLMCPCSNMLRREAAERWKLLHNEMRCQRAREGRVWIVSSDVTGEREDRISYGPTAVIAPNGDVVAQVPLLAERVLVVDVPVGDREDA